MRCNSESTFIAGTGHSPPCPELTPLSLFRCWICSTSCFPTKKAQQLPVELLSTQLAQEPALGAAGQLISRAPSWAQKGSAAVCWPPVAWGDNISDPALAPWVTAPGTPGFALPNKAEHQSCRMIPGTFPSHHTVINERISAVNSLGCFIIYLYFFCNTPEHNLKLPLASTRLTVPFFLLGNIAYSDHPILLPLPGDLAERMLMK